MDGKVSVMVAKYGMKQRVNKKSNDTTYGSKLTIEPEKNWESSRIDNKRNEGKLNLTERFKKTNKDLKRCILTDKISRAMFEDGLKFATLFNGTQKHLESKSDEELQTIAQQSNSQTQEETSDKKR